MQLKGKSFSSCPSSLEPWLWSSGLSFHIAHTRMVSIHGFQKYGRAKVRSSPHVVLSSDEHRDEPEAVVDLNLWLQAPLDQSLSQ